MAVLLWLLAACSGTVVETPVPELVRVAGSTAARPLLAELTTAYQAVHPEVSFELSEGGSRLGQAWVEAGTIDLAASSWLSTSAISGLRVTPIAWDAIVIAVHARNPISDVTLLELRDIYRGRLLDWSELGATGGEIVVVSREDGSGLRAAFEGAVMGDQHVTLTAVVMPSNSAVLEYVANHVNAIGYASLIGQSAAAAADGGVGPSAEPPNSVKTLPLEGVVPRPDTLTGGAYHLVTPLYMLAHEPLTPQLQSVLNFMLSPAGQAIVARYGGRIR